MVKGVNIVATFSNEEKLQSFPARSCNSKREPEVSPSHMHEYTSNRRLVSGREIELVFSIRFPL
jgi:hypothetical protein